AQLGGPLEQVVLLGGERARGGGNREHGGNPTCGGRDRRPDPAEMCLSVHYDPARPCQIKTMPVVRHATQLGPPAGVPVFPDPTRCVCPYRSMGAPSESSPGSGRPAESLRRRRVRDDGPVAVPRLPGLPPVLPRRRGRSPRRARGCGTGGPAPPV